MKNKKIKIFLGGYINERNTQNLNCLALTEFLDKDKFKIYALKKEHGNIDISHVEDKIQLFTYNKKRNFKFFNYIQALYYCDILYLPKRNYLSSILFLNKFFKKKVFLTIEGIVDDFIVDKINKQRRNGFQRFLKTINSMDYVYSITQYMKKYNEEKVGLKSQDSILYLGVDSEQFTQKAQISNKLKNIVFIGNDMQRKGIDEYIRVAKSHSNLQFHIVGANGENINFNKLQVKYQNIHYHGTLIPTQLNELLQTIDLYILPSKSEGFPKVILECAAVGIPSILYGTYGASEWISHNQNGFIVNSFEELYQKVEELSINQELLFTNSTNALELAKAFSWESVIKVWEDKIMTIV